MMSLMGNYSLPETEMLDAVVHMCYTLSIESEM